MWSTKTHARSHSNAHVKTERASTYPSIQVQIPRTSCEGEMQGAGGNELGGGGGAGFCEQRECKYESGCGGGVKGEVECEGEGEDACQGGGVVEVRLRV